MKHVKVKSDKSGKKRKRIILVAVLVIAVLLISAAWLFEHYYNMLDFRELKSDYDLNDYSYSDDNNDDVGKPLSDKEIDELEAYLRENLENEAEELDFNDRNVLNILLIGTDNREKNDAGYRSDSIIILSINKETKKIVMTSVLRDVYLQIPGAGSNRINAAHAIGGTELLIDTIAANFKIPIDKYIKLDFFSFMKVVDAIGGVDIKVTSEEIAVMQRYIREMNRIAGLPENNEMLYENDAGMLHLNGKQALAYSRNRYTGYGDFSRSERQRKVIFAIKDEIKEMSLAELNELANVLLPGITTNLTRGEVLSLILDLQDYLKYYMESFCIPAKNTYRLVMINGMSVISIDFAENSELWYNKVYVS